MSENIITMTKTGRNKEAAALATGTALVITEIAWGDGDRIPTGGETSLLNEQGRQEVQASGTVEGSLNRAFFRTFLDETVGPYVIREVGLYDQDGDLIAIGSRASAINKDVGSTTVTLDLRVVFSDLQNLVLQVNSVSAFVPQERRVDTGDGLQGGGDLSQDRTIEVTFATEPQAVAGISEVTVISPARLKDVLDSRINASLAQSGFEVMPSGRIEQWGRATLPITSANSASVIIALPMTWPTGLLSVQAIATSYGNSPAGGWPAVNVSAFTGSSITIVADMLNFATINQSIGIMWRAVGH